MKLMDEAFLEDIRLLTTADAGYDPEPAAALVQDELIGKLPGEPWKGVGQ